MLNKYSNIFEEMYERWLENKEEPIKIIKDYLPIFKRDELGILGIASYFEKYLIKKEFDQEHLILE